MAEEKRISRLWTVSTIFVICLSITVFYAFFSAIKPTFDENDGTSDSNITADPPVAHLDVRLGETREVILAFDSDGGYGFRVRHDYIIEVQPNSTADLVGLAIGDEILSVNDARIEEKHITSVSKNHTLLNHYYYFFTKIIFGYSYVECLIENAWKSGNGTVKLVVRRNMEVFKKVMRAHVGGAVLGFGDGLVAFALLVVAIAIDYSAAILKRTRNRSVPKFVFYKLSFRPFRLMYTTHPITDKEFDENYDRVLRDNDVWEEDDDKCGSVSEESGMFEGEKDSNLALHQA